MKLPNYQKELPEGYREVYHLNAKSAKTGVLFTLASLVPLLLILALAWFAAKWVGLSQNRYPVESLLFVPLILLTVCLLYIVLHELLHGLAYKKLTGQKLTFGLSWSCAFCGVPDIYTSRKTALIALALPFTVFTVLLVPLTIAFLFVDGILFLISSILLALHLSGCVGDLYLMLLLRFRYRDPRLLVRDTGPEQFLYLPKDAE